MDNDLISRSALLEDIEESVVFTVRSGQPSAEVRGANKIVNRINAAPAVDAAPKWISVEERLPEHEDRVLVACRTKKGAQSINLAYYSDGFWHGQGSMSGVTHWMPLPDLPEVI